MESEIGVHWNMGLSCVIRLCVAHAENTELVSWHFQEQISNKTAASQTLKQSRLVFQE